MLVVGAAGLRRTVRIAFWDEVAAAQDFGGTPSSGDTEKRGPDRINRWTAGIMFGTHYQSRSRSAGEPE